MEFLSELLEYLEDGGFVMWPLLFGIFALWYSLGYRFHRLKRGSKRSVRELIRRAQKSKCSTPKGLIDTAVIEAVHIAEECKDKKLARRLLDDHMFEYEQAIKHYKVLIKTIVVIAPLVGLLGTVIGMIETFDSLGSMSLYSQSGGIAGGISQALFTTQFGLVVAVPGVVLGRLLDKKEHNLSIELLQIKDLALSMRKL